MEAIKQYEELLKISKKVEKHEQNATKPALNPYRFTPKYVKLPIAFAALKMDLISSGIHKRQITTDEVIKYLSQKHKGPFQSLEVNSFQNIGINTLVDWTVREAARIHPAVEASKTRGIDRFERIMHVSKTGNAEWLEQRANEDIDEQTAVNNALWQKDIELEEKTSFRLKDVCQIF